MGRIGFRVERTITVDGPFQAHPTQDAKYAHATVDAQGQQHRVAVVVSGPSEFTWDMSDEDREEARGWFAIVDLARRSPKEFEQRDPRILPDLKVPIPDPPEGPRHRWTIDVVRDYVRQQLADYDLSHLKTTWRASPKEQRGAGPTDRTGP